jgi:hypothetical protein
VVAHDAHDTAPEVEKYPNEQVTHWVKVDAPEELKNVPAGHGVGEEELAGQYEPAGHGVADKEPAGQYEPPGHAVLFVDPSVQYDPAGHPIDMLTSLKYMLAGVVPSHAPKPQ